MAPKRTIELTDPRALRAVAHPTRLQLIGLLRRSGPLTATQAGELIGESAASASFHLRQLAKYGLVEEAGGGRGRERPWKATAMFTSWPDAGGGEETEAAAELLSSVIAERYFEGVMEWLERRRGETKQWREAEMFGDTILYLTAEEMVELGEQIEALAEKYLPRTANKKERPEGSRAVNLLHIAHPLADDEPGE
jgi:predicted ArsR family transcriptional regulator